MINISGLQLKYNDEVCESCGNKGAVGSFIAKEEVEYNREGSAQEIKKQKLLEVRCRCGDTLVQESSF